jgi:hypothetical protein
MNEQRAFQILCLLAGADKNRFGDLAKAKGMPDERIDECAFEYDQTSSSWDALLSSHMLNENEASATNIRIIYETSKTGTEAEEILKSSQILEGLRDELLSSFKLPHDLTLRGKSCEEDNAYWDPETREIIMCYELVDGLRERYKPSKP